MASVEGLQRTTTSEVLTPASAANAAAIPFLAAGVMDSTVPAAVKLIVTPGDAGGDAGNGDGGGGGGGRGSGAGGGAAGNGFPGDESNAPDAASPARRAATIVTAQATTPPRMRSRRFEPDGLTITAPLSSALCFVPALPAGCSVPHRTTLACSSCLLCWAAEADAAGAVGAVRALGDFAGSAQILLRNVARGALTKRLLLQRA